MPLALNLVLGPRGSARIEALRAPLRLGGLAASDIPAHVTLAVVESGEPGALVAAFPAPPPPTLRLVHIGVFLGPPGVVFVGVAPTAELVHLHDRTWQQVAADDGGWTRYQPGTWVPHCTLAMPLAPDEVGRALTILDGATLPLDVEVASLAVVDLDTGTTVATAWTSDGASPP